MTLPKGTFKVRNVERPFSVENKQSNKQTLWWVTFFLSLWLSPRLICQETLELIRKSKS